MGEHMSDLLDSTSLTPAALKKLSRSVMDLSTLSEMRDISKSTSELMTGKAITKWAKKKKKKRSESKTNLIDSSSEAIDTDETVRKRDAWEGGFGSRESTSV